MAPIPDRAWIGAGGTAPQQSQGEAKSGLGKLNPTAKAEGKAGIVPG